ncbi:hypothetical protein LTR91_019692 [Friedmanniomyces endolithicus]|uniref:Heterokaryon incompatibility domain-containing protein n=1 Tax=Friedmanniomyces endolithicus TaxID=329885 RepID=A0AAN6K518_9PEZI|nr:hypothetical protein LTR94_015814 [Friedmanniomyces endolithicus]KAK0783044.1 hypothetical protein LTR38_013152 [Friedmanniomyces endolithicus]KAK0787797.1 hypothetical protein LTR75_012795 [Friedmanniomyces endolithicus]KAK0788834.1 hypothetical protein LTR59_009850 [Friedmanniomyces endolithicus]KAK0844838.1 hypothetical protein LTR03_007833 [Friedmanniomyces endolithicus]
MAESNTIRDGLNGIACASNKNESTATLAIATDPITPDSSTLSPSISAASEAVDGPLRSTAPSQLYKVLSARQFQLLRLFATKKDDSIRCCLQTFTAGSPDCPSYRAVSYAWGPETSTIKPIYIGSQGDALRQEATYECRHLSSQNLFDLLDQLHRERSDSWLWIDALCINQDDTDERGQQVKIMGDIFRSANLVLAWLGPVTSCNSHSDRELTKRDHHTHIRVPCSVRDDSTGRSVEGQGICALPYWKRRWIVQEVLLARSVVLQFREKQFTMAALEAAAELANKETSAPRYIQVEIDQMRQSAGARLALHSLRKRTGMAFPRRLKELLVRYEDRECQQPYDLVFALHSLIDQKYRDKLQVNYNQSAEEYFCAVISFMHEHEDLGIEGVRIAWLLLEVLDPTSIDAFRMPSQGLGLHRPFEMRASVFKLGSRPRMLGESGLSISARPNVATMSPILPWNLQLDSGLWVPEQRTNANLATTAFSIGSQDMLFFEIPDTSQRGLAAMADPQFSSEDEVWLFAHTTYAFIVTSDPFGSMTIRGRALLLNPDGEVYNGSELYPYPHIVEGLKSTVSSASSVDMKLTIPDLITLATMAKKAILD